MSVRLFIAVNFNIDTCSWLVALRDELRKRSQHGNFSRDENLHLTLAFLGECNANQTAAVKEAMNAVIFEPFEAAIDQIGCFKRDGGDIWWAGLREEKPLMSMQRELSARLRDSGFIIENRKYSPHITLGREVVTKNVPWQIEPFGETVSKIDLMKSERIDGKLTHTSIYRRGTL